MRWWSVFSSENGKRHVLIVEDTPESARVYRRVVELAGHVPLVAADSVEAMELIQRHGAPPLILMDVKLPGESGLDFTRRLRELPELASTRIVGLSALGLDLDRRHALEAGMNDYIAKPFEASKLEERIKEWLSW